MTNSREIRLQKFISDCGVTSRRKAEELILQGRVSVNGEVVQVLGTKIDPVNDAVSVDGEMIDRNQIQKIYMVMNKPRGYMTTLSDPEGRKTVMDLCKEVSERIYPVGRLDYLSEGLLILTNDGDVANMIMHPSHEIIKVYEVKVFGAVTEDILKKLRSGTRLDNNIFIKPMSVRVIEQLSGKTWLEFRLGEGKNREIRKICEAHDVTVDKLKRVAIGNLTISSLAPSNYYFLTKKQLLKEIGITEEGIPASAQPREFFSPKKTVNLKLKGAQLGASRADDEGFKKFRRESYFDTIKKLKIKKVKEESEKVQEEFRVKEEQHQKRVKSKTTRQNSKLNSKKPLHAKIVKN
jgi:23S rRNA pseudouridine2605 synthase